MIEVNSLHPFWLKSGVTTGEFSRRFRNPDGIACRVPDVWVITFPTCFNFCPLYSELQAPLGGPTQFHVQVLEFVVYYNLNLVLLQRGGGIFIVFTDIRCELYVFFYCSLVQYILKLC